MIYFKRNKIAERTVWHVWFAWYPVCVKETPDSDAKIIWMEPVMRCYVPYRFFYDYGHYCIRYNKTYKELNPSQDSGAEGLKK